LTDAAGNKTGLQALDESQTVGTALGSHGDLVFAPMTSNYEGSLELKVLNEVSFKCEICKFDPNSVCAIVLEWSDRIGSNPTQSNPIQSNPIRFNPIRFDLCLSPSSLVV
jgi:hypothetical protein